MTSPVGKNCERILPMGIDDMLSNGAAQGWGEEGCFLQDRARKGKRRGPNGQDLAGHICGVQLHQECS